MIHRDDLRYTDDVIATLQSSNPLWYIANALNIDIADVKYHYAEVMTMSHNGKVLPLRIDDTRLTSFRRPQRPYTKSAMMPRDPQWYKERTVTEIANELGQELTFVKSFVYRWGYKTKRAIMGTRYRTEWPTDPAYYAARTSHEIAHDLGLSVTTVQHHTRKHGITLHRAYRFVDWPTDPQFYAERTTVEIRQILNTSIDNIHAHCKKHGLTIKPYRKSISWPKDPQWYAERTRQEIADELDVTYNAVARHVWTYRIKCKKEPHHMREKFKKVTP